MLYDYQYTVIAVVTTLVLLIIIYQRKGYSSADNRVFMSLIYVNLLGAAADLFTYWTISYPEDYSHTVLYASNIVYLLLFGLTGLTFVRYIMTLTGEEKAIRAGWIQYLIAAAVEAALILTTPRTGLIIYFDEQLAYHHGRLFWLLYLIPIALNANALAYAYIRSRWMRPLQKATAVTIFIIVMLASSFQIANAKADLFHLTCVLVLLVVYIVFENPVYYTYHATRCLGSRAFYEELRHMGQADPESGFLLICITNSPRNHGVQEAGILTALMDEAAERLYDHLGRRVFCLAGGRFVLMVSAEQYKDPQAVGDKVRALFEKPLQVDREPIQAVLRIRDFKLREVMVSDDYADHLVEILQQAPMMQLLAEPEIGRLVLQQHEYREVEDALANAISRDWFYMMYQPIYDLTAETFHSAEALLRLRDPEMGLIRPDVFISIAEKNGSIVRIGEMLFEKVCAFLADHRESLPGLHYLEVNVSPMQLVQPEMSRRFIRIMEKYGVSASAINMEITESALDITDAVVMENIRALQRFGVSFSIDDYGSGFASASYLYSLPVSIVKIDRGVLLQAMQDEEAGIVFEDTIRTASRLGKKVLVEGAEDADMVRLIRDCGGDFIQGYYYSKPLEAAAFTAFMQEQPRQA